MLLLNMPSLFMYNKFRPYEMLFEPPLIILHSVGRDMDVMVRSRVLDLH